VPPFVKLAIGGTVAAAFAALLLWRLDHASGGGRAAAEALSPPVPVTETAVTMRNVPQVLYGLGTVQAYNTVAVKSRVDGQIVKLFFKEGDEVRAGDPLIEIDPHPYQAARDAAQAQKEKDEAQLETAKADLARSAKLVGRGYQTVQQYDQQKGLVKQLEAAVKRDEAQIESAGLNLGYTDIRAPIAGRLGARLVDVGNFVRAADNITLVTINEVKPIFVSFTLPQDRLDAVRQSEKDAPLPVIASSGDGKSVLGRGRLTFIDNAVDQSTGTIRLKARFANNEERLWPGEFVDVKVVLRILQGVPTVPSPTVEEGPNGHYVYVIGNNDTVEQRSVEIGESEGGITVVEKGLKPGEKVVVEGQYRLKEGARVAPRPFKRARAAGGAEAPS
jgi:membrane fusion protein, multidrug efflux system